MAEASGLPDPQANTSPFASQRSHAGVAPTESASMVQELQAPRALSPSTLLSRPVSAQGFRSPSSWFNRTSSTTSSGHLKHSLLDMVPSQPLSRPISPAPPSPASQLQPPTIPAPSPVSPLVSTPKESAAVLEGNAEHAEGSKQPQGEQGTETMDEKQTKRNKRMRKTEAKMRWQLMRRLADISSDVELLNHEVSHLHKQLDSHS